MVNMVSDIKSLFFRIMAKRDYNQTTLDEFGFDPKFIGVYRNEEFVLRMYTYGFELEKSDGFYAFKGKTIEKELGEDFIRDLRYPSNVYVDPDNLFMQIELECDFDADDLSD